MPISKLLAWTFLALNLSVLTACNIPSPQARENAENGAEIATFFVTEAKGESLNTTLSSDYAVPKSKQFSFSVCLKDQAQSKPLVGHPFRVEQLEKELKTDQKGCLNWTEDVPFNFFSEPKYIEWSREITATGLHKGTRKVRFAINPWNDTDKTAAVVNLATVTPLKLVKNLEENTSEGKNSLWVNEMRIQSNSQKFTSEGLIINIELMANPQLQIKAMNGERVLRPISQGRFKTKIYLLHSVVENNVEKHRILANSGFETSEVHNGSLFLKAPLLLKSRPTNGQLILGMDISAEGKNDSIGTFHGVYLIGDYDQIKTNGFLKLMRVVTETENFKIENFINAKLEATDGFVKPKIEILPLDISFLHVGKETFSTREVNYRFTACLKNGVDQKITLGYGFKVSGFQQDGMTSEAPPKVNVDNAGCIYWDQGITFKPLECNKSLVGSVSIENKELAIQEKISVALNPWDTALKGRDLSRSHNEDFVVTDCKKAQKLPSTLNLRSYTFTSVSYLNKSENNVIDHLLNLSVKKKLRFKIEASISKLSDMTLGMEQPPQRLRPGVYLLKMALIKNRDYYNGKTYITSIEKLVSTLDGDIKADLEFATSDLKALADRNTLLVELNPVQESKVKVEEDGSVTTKEKVSSLDEVVDANTGLYTRTFTAPMVLNLEKDAQEFLPLDAKMASEYLVSANLPAVTAEQSVVREYIKYGQKLAAENYMAQKAQSDIGLFAKNNSLKLYSAAHATTSQDLRAALAMAPSRMTEAQTSVELKALAVSGKLSKTLTQGLCSYWFRTLNKDAVQSVYAQNALINCGLRAGQPENLFMVEKRLFVKELGGYQYVKGYNDGVTIGNNITLTKSHAKSNYVTKSLTFNMGLTQKFADIFSVGVSGSYAISQSVQDAEASANSTSVTSNLSLVMQQNIYSLKLKRYRECSIVRMNPKLFASKGLFDGVLNAAYNEAQKAEIATRGIMVCAGQDNTTPVVKKENYYMLTQDVTSLHTQDNGDERNRNFFIALRGEKEFNRLMYFMRGNLKTPKSAGVDHDDQKSTLSGLDTLMNTGTANVPGAFNDTGL
jgi:hypothetical protein